LPSVFVHTINHFASRPKGTGDGTEHEGGSGEYRCLLAACEIKKTIGRHHAWTAGSRAYTRSKAGADSGTDEGVAQAMVVLYQADDADVLPLDALLAGFLLQCDCGIGDTRELSGVFPGVCFDHLDLLAASQRAQVVPG